MRLALLLALLLVGCRPTIDYPDVYADLACETAYATLRARGEAHPSPKPPAGDQCENCKGTGKKLKSVLVKPCPDGRCRP